MQKYQDYVIRDGKFVGKFEEMYQVFQDPWNQSQTVESKSRLLTIQSLKEHAILSLVEFGCGLGHYTNTIHSKIPNMRIHGVDVSATAIEKARRLYPHIEFSVDEATSIDKYADHDAILFAELTWYILPDLNQIFEKMLETMPGKLFLHDLAFYFEQDQKYGREYFTSIDEFIKVCPFQLIEKNVSQNWDKRSISTHCVFKIARK